MIEKDFIAEFPLAFTKDFCEKVINAFEDKSKLNFTIQRHQEGVSSLKKNDEATFIVAEDINSNSALSGDDINIFTKVFWKDCFLQYQEKYGMLNELEQYAIYDFKIQKTLPGQGYHIWHCENDGKKNRNRLLAWAIFLNDVEEGGETEFLYQHKRIKAEQGKLVMFPAYFTHTHRGNPPISGNKYIATGWVEF